jgi:hypothetical protein
MPGVAAFMTLATVALVRGVFICWFALRVLLSKGLPQSRVRSARGKLRIRRGNNESTLRL